MKAIKTIFFWLFIVLCLGAGIYSYFHLKNSKKPALNALAVMPDSCLIYLKTNDFFELNKKINSQSLISDKLSAFSEINSLLQVSQEFDSILHSNETVQEMIFENLIHYAKYESAYLITFNIKQLGEQQNIQADLIELLQAQAATENCFQFTNRNKTKFYFQLQDGVALISDSPDLIERSLQSNRTKLFQNPSFIEFKSTLSENTLLSVFVNHTLYAKQKSKLNLSLITKGGYSVGSIDFQPSQIIANGYYKPDSTTIFQKLFNEESHESKSLAEIFPQNTIAFKSYALSSLHHFSQQLPESELSKEYWQELNARALYNLKLEFENNVVSQISEFSTQNGKNNCIVTQIQDEEKALENLQALSDTLLMQDSIRIYKIHSPEKKSNSKLFEAIFNTSTNYACLFGTQIYFSQDVEQLVKIIKQLEMEKNLSLNLSFVSYMNQQFPDEYSFLLYNSPNQIQNEIPQFFNFTNKTGSIPFQNFKHFSYCLSKDSKHYKFRTHLLYESDAKTPEQNVLWTLHLDTIPATAVYEFLNHNTNEKELLVQDANYVLYLINAKGTILWKKQLNEKILSKIHTVDIYKNGKFQILFNTKSALHLIDRNSNYVENYPVKLPSEASNELSLFDYDLDKEYRILIACKNNSIYNYNIHGIKQEKFTVVKTDNEVELPIQYVKIASSDYLVAMDKEGKLYTFSRKGIGRIGLRNRAVANCKAFYCDLNNSINNSYIVYVDDKSGLINKISFDDRKEIVKLDSYVENGDIKFCLIDDNRSMDLVLTKDNSIWSYNFSGNLISEINCTKNLSESDFFKDESHAFYFSLNEDRTEILLQDIINQKTQTLKGNMLPYISNLFGDHKNYLILSNDENLSCVRIN